ncbi:hypothetical protein PR003_g10065 [Phytophthora rubi]|uniref:Uncharacterized protein n=1 Tax=Phytophthora rubi TaxID=129364 RepID=A0A6A4FCG5_9STRA|nr:hypothetical protein PR002_g11310 [Phytophthora rubi]KAE9030565.1 hypothetical protein PR001_g11220 [Phytophthora rubi]KAE9341286.1 hypothetical protein PR003_g10065 [Phytophthora rubi]
MRAPAVGTACTWCLTCCQIGTKAGNHHCGEVGSLKTVLRSSQLRLRLTNAASSLSRVDAT